jgi:serine protease Do
MWYRKLLLVGIGIGLLTSSGKAQLVVQSPRGLEPTSFLGVFLQEINSDRAKALRLPEETGVEITRVDPNSPAAGAGLMAGDVIVQYNGQRVEGMDQFQRMVRETPAGRDVRLQIFRNGAMQTVTAKIGSHAAGPQALAIRPPNPPAQVFAFSSRNSILGTESEPLTGQLADYFGVKDGGVLVRSVAANSVAERAGIKAGDVITKVGEAKVVTPPEVTSQLRAQRGGAVGVTLLRDHREMTVTVMLDSGDNSRRF